MLRNPLANPVHGAPHCSLNFSSPASVRRVHGRQHDATHAASHAQALSIVCRQPCFVVGWSPLRRSGPGTPSFFLVLTDTPFLAEQSSFFSVLSGQSPE